MKELKGEKVDDVQKNGGKQLTSRYSSSNASPLSFKGRKATPSTSQIIQLKIKIRKISILDKQRETKTNNELKEK